MPWSPKPFRSKDQAAARKAKAKQRGKTSERGYGWRWQQYRNVYFADVANIWCRACLAKDPPKRTPASDIDHINAVTSKDDPRFWDPANHQPLCHACHSEKTVREDGGFGRGP